MGASTAGISDEGLIADKSGLWILEIRDFLLGQLSKRSGVAPLPAAQRVPSGHIPIRRWWIFEGKRFAVLGGNLASNWERAVRHAQALDRTHNPRLRLSDRADGLVDWPTTLARGAGQRPQSYVVRSSGVGLGDDERSALRGWVSWVTREWRAYAERHDLNARPAWGSLLEDRGEATEPQLRRWLHVCRRSRWPFLRQVVAETLRPVLEVSDLDRIPLPTDRAKLFELLCLVRLARLVGQPPRDLRWLDMDLGQNTLKLEGATLWYQQTLSRDAVLATQCYGGGLAAAVEAFSLRVHRFVDVAVEFGEPRNGFDGILVEAKSGLQGFDDAAFQLQVYRSARPRRPGSRYLCWGIVEHPPAPGLSAAGVAHIDSHTATAEDLWIFSGVDGIPDVVESLGIGVRG